MRLIPLPNAAVPVLMYFPEYNAILVPAESISPEYLPSSRRKKPIGGLVKLIKESITGLQSSDGKTSIPAEKSVTTVPADDPVANSNETDTSNSVETELMNSAEEESSVSVSAEESISSTETGPVSQYSPALKLTHQPMKQSEDVLTKTPPQPMLRVGVKEDRPQGNTFGQLSQLFQRPNAPFIPDGVSPEESVNFVQNQPAKPSLTSFIPPILTNYLANPPKRPISTFLETRFPFIAPLVAPRSPYVHYYTKTPTSEAFYYNSLHPSVNTAVYTDAVQGDITDYINKVQESLLHEQIDVPTTTNSNSAMMVASVPVGNNQATSLLLRPVAKAVAGAKGVAVASPVAKAVLRKGEKVDIDFDPDAVAIAGPGGQAHAHPKLIISYDEDDNEESKDTPNNPSS